MRSLACLWFPSLLLAQVDTVVTEQRVRDAVAWLAADERQGRDTPSPQLAETAQWLARRFAAADLKQVVKDSWFHDYTLPGLRIDSAAIAVTLHRKLHQDEKDVVLEPGRDVRLWRAGEAVGGDREGATVAHVEDPVLQQQLTAQSGRRPTFVEVGEDHPWWQRAAGARDALGGRRAAARPIFLVRKGLLPAAPTDGHEALWAATWQAPAAEKVDVPLQNVMALLPGSSKRDEYVVVSAHYDHIGLGNPVAGDFVNNGADDDATGTAAVVLIAEAMARQPPPARSVLFVCFSGEEKGLRGSAAFVAAPPVPKDRIVANVNLEMLGRPEPGQQGKAWITGHDLSDFAAIATAALGRAGVEVVDFPMAAQLFAASDNWSFARQGIVAHSISAGSLHEDYHRPGDEVGKLDIAHMTKVIRGLCDVVRAFADRDGQPAWNEKGQARLARQRR